MLASIKTHHLGKCLTICVLHWRFPAAFNCYNYTKNVETRTSKKGIVAFYRYLFHLSLQIGLGLAGFTIIPWLLIVIGFGWLTVVSIYTCMHVYSYQ